MSSAIPNSGPEIDTTLLDIRKVNFNAGLGGYTSADATSAVVRSFNVVRDDSYMRRLLEPVMAASFDRLTIRLVPDFGTAFGMVRVSCGWGHSEMSAPANEDEVSRLLGSVQFFFGNAGEGVVFSPPPMEISCPFSMGVSHQAKPRDLYGGLPVFFVFCRFTRASDVNIGSNPVTLFQVHGSASLSVKGTDLVVHF